MPLSHLFGKSAASRDCLKMPPIFLQKENSYFIYQTEIAVKGTFFFRGPSPFYPSVLQCEPVVVLHVVPKDLFHPPVVPDSVYGAVVCYPLLMLSCSGNAFHHFEVDVGPLVHGHQALKGNAVTKIKQPYTISRASNILRWCDIA